MYSAPERQRSAPWREARNVANSFSPPTSLPPCATWECKSRLFIIDAMAPLIKSKTMNGGPSPLSMVKARRNFDEQNFSPAYHPIIVIFAELTSVSHCLSTQLSLPLSASSSFVPSRYCRGISFF